MVCCYCRCAVNMWIIAKERAVGQVNFDADENHLHVSSPNRFLSRTKPSKQTLRWMPADILYYLLVLTNPIQMQNNPIRNDAKCNNTPQAHVCFVECLLSAAYVCVLSWRWVGGWWACVWMCVCVCVWACFKRECKANGIYHKVCNEKRVASHCRMDELLAIHIQFVTGLHNEWYTSGQTDTRSHKSIFKCKCNHKMFPFTTSSTINARFTANQPTSQLAPIELLMVNTFGCRTPKHVCDVISGVDLLYTLPFRPPHALLPVLRPSIPTHTHTPNDN